MGIYIYFEDSFHNSGFVGIVWELSFICLFIGILIGFYKRDYQLLYFLISIGLGEILIAAAIMFPVSLSDSTTIRVLLVYEGVALAYAYYKSRRSYHAATCLTFFEFPCLMYGSLLSAMSLSGAFL